MNKSADFWKNRAWLGNAFGLLVLLASPVLVLGGIEGLDSLPPANLGSEDRTNCLALAAMAGLLLVYFVALFKISDQQRDLAFAQLCETWR
jgi:hypothetical protein